MYQDKLKIDVFQVRERPQRKCGRVAWPLGRGIAATVRMRMFEGSLIGSA